MKNSFIGYSIGELACEYFPKSSRESASRQFKAWINRSPELLRRLTESGYKKGVSLLTVKQIEILLEHFGSPFDD